MLTNITSSAIRKLIAKETIQKLRRIIVHKKLDMLLLVTLSNGFLGGITLGVIVNVCNCPLLLELGWWAPRGTHVDPRNIYVTIGWCIG